ncbi:glucose-6-phosphate isomerase [Methylococcus sp. EFPC2]|uniref:glucose-6-phosphate isomerase n=1 Tax=Methylococcus sp. EFPC2 TaxID=2812648 RepID=UPI0019679671|nr:glucose-6-phosphate isomerase [Methylococcus sp. EFPC2]QSA96589.1 glucose-6-phosphate isomerase [Methylococcus sp. EFPC2]
MPQLTHKPAWLALQEEFRETSKLHMRDLFAHEPGRFQRFSLQLGDLLFDFSKNRITDQTFRILVDLAHETDVKARIESMFRGDRINVTENRAVLHVALRNRSQRPIRVDGHDVMPEVNRVLQKMRHFSESLRSHEWRGYTGKPISNVVNIGIGGSDLGPKMVVKALTPFHKVGLKVHFVSNVDEADLMEVVRELDQETTLFIVASKTFTTQETMTNAHSARDWFLAKARDEDAIARHFVAVSTNAERVAQFGIDTANMFEFWDWVGGRYSLWSAIGLPIAVAIGMDHFEELLAGAHQVDEHFRVEPFERNIPVVMALLGIWYNNFFDAQSQAILPYDQYLEHLPAYLQQADMESDGKTVDLDGCPIDYSTGPVIFGQPGTNGQHAFYQLIHQGSKLIPCDFLAAARSHHDLGAHHAILLSNFLAQPEAMMRGKSRDQARAELEEEGVTGEVLDRLSMARAFPGNRPSNAILYRQLDPHTLGMLIALYEHKIFVQGAIWNINSFDQMGVELGKQLARSILGELEDDKPVEGHDSSTNGLINHYKRLR